MPSWLFKLLAILRDMVWPQKSHVLPLQVTGSPQVIQPVISNPSANWVPYSTQPFDTQHHGTFDAENCVTEAGIHLVEHILNFALKNNKLPVDLANLLKNPQNGFMNDQGFIELSVRFSSALNGTTQYGLSMDAFWECLNRDGFVSKKLWPDPINYTRDEYYQKPSDGVVLAGKDAAKIFQWSWKVIINNNWNAPDLNAIKQKLVTSPIHFASMICGSVNGVEQWCGVKAYQHSRLLRNIDEYLEVLDSEGAPEKKLALNFPLPCCITASLNIE